MMVMMLMLVLFVFGGMLGVGLLSQLAQLLHEIVLSLHRGDNLRALEAVPRGRNNGRGGVFLAQHGHGGGNLFRVGALGAAEDDAAGVADLVVVELAEVFHVQLDLVHIRHSDKAVELDGQMLGHAFHGAGHIAELADARGLDKDAVGVVLLDNLFQRLAEIADEAAADAAGVQLVDLDAGFLQKAAVDADFAEFVLNEHDLLALKGFLNQLFDKRCFACAQKTGKNVYLGHCSASFFYFDTSRAPLCGGENANCLRLSLL